MVLSEIPSSSLGKAVGAMKDARSIVAMPRRPREIECCRSHDDKMDMTDMSHLLCAIEWLTRGYEVMIPRHAERDKASARISARGDRLPQSRSCLPWFGVPAYAATAAATAESAERKVQAMNRWNG